jgi:hypothetical protein
VSKMYGPGEKLYTVMIQVKLKQTEGWEEFLKLRQTAPKIFLGLYLCAYFKSSFT